MLGLTRPDSQRNPLRPEAIGLALVEGVDTLSDRPDVRKLLSAEIGRTLATLMRQTYADIVAELRRDGVQPLGLALRGATAGDTGNSRAGRFDGRDSRAGGLPRDSRHGPATGASGPSGLSTGHGSPHSGYGSRHGGGGVGGAQDRSGPGTGRDGLGGPSTGGRDHGGGAAGGHWDGPPPDALDAHLSMLIRRLAQLGPEGGGGRTDFGTTGDAAHLGSATTPGGAGLRNLIVAHRDELRQAATGTLDHMVIDVVGSLFDQVLSDPKVPPHMARQIARLQLPVLRVALADVTFFSSRRHPVRRFVNRIASLACAFDDVGEDSGRRLLALVRELVQQIVQGDFDQMALYERKLDELEAFVAEAAREDIRGDDGSDPGEVLAQRERELLQQQRYMQQLQSALTAVDVQDFLRDFIAQVWSQAMVQARREHGEEAALTQRLRHAGRELLMSVQPKGTPAERKAFLLRLPQLMKDLNDGMSLIGWPESARKQFFAQLLPAHAESLKGQSLRTLDHNLLVKQLDAILAAPVPEPGAPPAGALLPTLDDVVATPDLGLSDEQAQAVGLVRETEVDWNGQVDIDLSDEPELSEVDIHIDGLPSPNAAERAEPTRGAALAEHVQLGMAYQMHLEGEWQKVRLTYVSPGRAFFIFSRGRKHQKTISLTARMLRRLCESGRMRAFESAYLLERATARARKQLAAMTPPPGRAGAAAATLRH
ncbi:DUF1631 family protein [Aquabacterium sp. J223]|uniref:DUF1631 family protein n=1 Tax=Aquabacterium sp. J223 TaxID=2898431 RepID=UPI0028A2460B|nr:DUF1631 family protein [Aquabacterium sp. J223]